jgi:type VI protein secretion system component Hcp
MTFQGDGCPPVEPPKATLFVRKAGGDQQEYLKVTLEDCLVSSFKAAPQAPGVGQTEL